jgi:hypothetical protein
MKKNWISIETQHVSRWNIIADQFRIDSQIENVINKEMEAMVMVELAWKLKLSNSSAFSLVGLGQLANWL